MCEPGIESSNSQAYSIRITPRKNTVAGMSNGPAFFHDAAHAKMKGNIKRLENRIFPPERSPRLRGKTVVGAGGGIIAGAKL